MVDNADRALRDLEKALTGRTKKENPWWTVTKLIAVLVGTVSYIIFALWTLYDAVVVAEGGLEIRLGVYLGIILVMMVWAVAKQVYKK